MEVEGHERQAASQRFFRRQELHLARSRTSVLRQEIRRHLRVRFDESLLFREHSWYEPLSAGVAPIVVPGHEQLRRTGDFPAARVELLLFNSIEDVALARNLRAGLHASRIDVVPEKHDLGSAAKLVGHFRSSARVGSSDSGAPPPPIG